MKLNQIRDVLSSSWDRTKAETFTLSSFQEVDQALAGLDEDGQSEILQECNTYLATNPKSIVAMYAAGSIQLARHGQEDNLNLLNLAETFLALGKHDEVQFLCDKILTVSENRHALRILAKDYENLGKEDEKFKLYERLVRADHDEVAIVREIADRANKAGDKEKATTYYKVALDRVLIRQEGNLIKPLFDNLFKLCPEQFDYFLGITGKVGALSPATAIALLRDMDTYSKDDIDRKITCEKKILGLDHEDSLARNSLVASYKKKYAGHSRLDTCLRESGLTRAGNHDIVHAIEDFEKNISFDKGTFVYQSSRGRIGRIRSINANEVVIDFPGQKDGGTKMTPAMAFKSLKALKKSHILVLKGCVSHDKLAQKTMGQPQWMLDILLSSFDGKCSLKQMKKELVPEVLSDSQWSVWSKQAKELLMNDVHYGVSPDDDSYILRETPISYEEKQLSIFNAHDKFYDKVKDLKKFIADKGNTDSEFFYEMVKYFGNILENRKDEAELDDEMLGSYLLLDDLLNHRKMTFIKIPPEVSFLKLIGKVSNPDKIPALFGKIEDADLKKCFIDWTVETQPKEWSELLLKLFPYYLNTYIPSIYTRKKKGQLFMTIYQTAVDNYRDYANTLIYLIKASSPADWGKAGITMEKLLYTKLTLLSFLNQKVEARVDGQEAGANAKILCEMLFGTKGRNATEGEVYTTIKAGDANIARNINSLVQSCTGLDEGEKINVKFQIQTQYPDLDLDNKKVELKNESFVPTGWFCTSESLAQKKAELDHIQHVELPDVAKEISDARAKGDLRENSEYQYGKDKRHLLQKKEAELKAEIDKAIVVDLTKVDPSKSGFGTVVDVTNLKSGEKATYTIMGPWESDPEKYVINILAPLGNALCNHSVGDTFDFQMGDQTVTYRMDAIRLVKA